MKQTKIYIYLIIGLGLFLFGLWAGCNINKPKKSNPDKSIVYLTDTVFRPKYIEPEIGDKEEEKPGLVTNFNEKPTHDPRLKKLIEVLSDSLFVYKNRLKNFKPDTLGKQAIVQALQTRQLTFGKFTGDSIKLTFRAIDGSYSLQDYLVDYDNKEYFYKDGILRNEAINKTPTQSRAKRVKTYSGVSVFGGYDILTNRSVGAIKYNFLSYRNFEPTARLQFDYSKEQKKLDPQLQVGVSYNVR